ncbi:methyltransferase domain-containing protein [Frankia sp. CNm7]|uniref:Methyltransferase domain-containing protein n=1 Tax=Frankia nepalensis TaxID=1836974 RepID=A0A937RKC2_9ACTN|nr:class I SAM-dependent methyltransferase [Frankia nepalensis]MBL7496851.1 methyltransferase domain-containing protein [Frankia nepalensis]MBL7514675.1 methyltransferase domain-containing protein [Frankia nepalensis]MBL7524582.1 methyltransferase domain-containing protein [Frankia nepalensis]MBL7630490.1 methyltransferase domain-containing protein [Frankia nepalensis]
MRETTRTAPSRQPKLPGRPGPRRAGLRPRPTRSRGRQLCYSETEPRTLDEFTRRRKARKLIAVLAHFLGRDGRDGPRVLAGLRVLDVGCSAGFIADELAAAGAEVTGVDIDVAGLRRARARFARRARFVQADGLALPLPDGAVDVVILNHIYEHVVDADELVAEACRVLAPDGIVYLGLGNRLGVVEPHHRLPMLSWLPPVLADAYLRVTGRGEHYYERYRTRRGLRRMLTRVGLRAWDYTAAVMLAPETFHAEADLPRLPWLGTPPPWLAGLAARLPGAGRPPGRRSVAARAWLARAALPFAPTYLWVATPGPRRPGGRTLPAGPRPVHARPPAAVLAGPGVPAARNQGGTRPGLGRPIRGGG